MLVVFLMSKYQVLVLVLFNEKIQDGFNVLDSLILFVIVLWNGIGIFCYDIMLFIIIFKDM